MSAMIHICLKDMKPHFYAPDVNICETVDHFIKKPDPDSPSRNALVEAARIARSDIKPLCQCQACKHEALVIPGGFGAAKTLLVICCVDSDLKERLNETNNFVGNFTFDAKKKIEFKNKVQGFNLLVRFTKPISLDNCIRFYSIVFLRRSNFAEKGADCTIHPDLEQIIEDFYYEGKPIASICISSVLVARVLKGVKITLGKECKCGQ